MAPVSCSLHVATDRATYRQLVEQSEEIGRGLMSRGVEKGDRVGIWSPNGHEWVLVQYATAAIGAILVNINPAYRTSELQYALNQSGISFLVLAAGFRTADYRAMLAEVKSSCPRSEEHTSELSHPSISYAVFCLKKKNYQHAHHLLAQTNQNNNSIHIK